MPIIFDNITFTGGILLSGASGTPAPVIDPNFKYTTLLLDGLGTNGAQNNTFLDSSSNNFTITRVGNTTQGSFTPFSHSNGYWSNYFDGSGDYLSIPTSSANLSQTGDWTYEGWAYWNVVPTAGYQNIFGQGAAGQTTYGLTIFGGKFTVNQANGGNRITGTTTVVTGTWYHFALVRSSNVIRLYVNGNLEGTPYTDSGSYGFNGNPFTIGNNSNGYISNFRFNRTAVYTSNFTPSTTPLTAITGTQLLTCQNNNFKDNSSNNFVVTSVGNSAVTLFQPFTLSTEYNSSTMGGSMYFDGSGDYLLTTNSLSGAGNFTIECWVYPTAAASGKALFGAPNWELYLSTFTVRFVYQFVADYNSSLVLVPDTWNHVVVERYGFVSGSAGGYKIFVNGVMYDTGSSATGGGTALPVESGFLVGGSYNNSSPRNLWAGYISNLRVVNGTAVYTSAFTPPTSPVTAISGTSLLLNGTNAGVVDSTGFNNAETVGNAQISTAQSKWGGSSMYFDGTNSRLTIANNAAFNQTGSWTVEMWIYSVKRGAAQYFYTQSTSGYAQLTLNSSNFLEIDLSGVGVRGTSTAVIPANTWTHVAMVSNGTQIRLFVDGILQGTPAAFTGVNSAKALTIGSYDSPSLYFGGYIQGLRVTNGIARYTTTFTPPTDY